jgi:hypothetical protein
LTGGCMLTLLVGVGCWNFFFNLGLKTLVIIITIIIIIIIICPIILGLTSDSSRKQSLVYSYSNNSAQKA